MALAAVWLPACSSDARGESADPCPGRRYGPDANVAITRELLRVTRGLAVGASEGVRAIVEAVDRFNEEQRPFRDTGECGPDPEGAETYLFTIQYLVAHPDRASPQLLQALQDVADPEQPGAPGGIDGISLFLQDASLHEPDYPGLADLRMTLIDQELVVDGRQPDRTDIPQLPGAGSNDERQPTPNTSASSAAAS